MRWPTLNKLASRRLTVGRFPNDHRGRKSSTARSLKANHGNGLAGFLQSNPMTPQIPHMASTRGMQEGAAGAEELLADADSADAEAPFAEPAQRDPEEA
jgi:hypothetical protein